MAVFAGGLLIALTIPALVINLYFTSLLLGWAGPRRRLGSFLTWCGAETSSCGLLASTRYARLFGGAPNVAAGIPWCLGLLWLAGGWIAGGRLFVPWPFLVAALGSLVVGAYLVHALVVVLKQPCPL